jgi:hypothetical protein
MKILNQEPPKALFLGNGINRVAQGAISWGSLLENISGEFEIDIDLQNDLKPFPLAFEEMLVHKKGKNPYEKLHKLKQYIGHIFTTAAIDNEQLELHGRFMNSGIREIITTNYDYNLERSICPDFEAQKKVQALNNQESKHSLYRGYRINGVNVRHIHGELFHNRKISVTSNYPEESIMIGFEHYADYFLKIQDMVYGVKGKRRYTNQGGILGRTSANAAAKSWTDLFFTHDIHFIGFTLDFSESHLWWILMQRHEITKKFGSEQVVRNRIVFYYPELPMEPLEYACRDEESFNRLYRIRLTQQKNKAVTDILKALNVEILPVKCASYLSFYDKMIEQLKDDLL